MRALAFVIVLVLLPPGADAQTPPCAVSTDPQFGYTREKPILVGGGVQVGSGRERRYLSVLRGPAGQVVTVLPGVGSAPDPVSKQIIDTIQVTYEGLEKPISLFLNMYAFAAPQVPQGFTCSESPSAAIGPPPPDPAATIAVITAHALAEGVNRALNPLNLSDAGGTPRAIVFDFFNLASARAQREASQGRTLGSQIPAATLIVAHPLQCAGTFISATAIDIVGARGQVAPRAPQLGDAGMLATVVPGATLPQGAVGVLMPSPFLPTPGSVRINYPKADACPDLPQEVLIALRPEGSQLRSSELPVLPAGNTEPDPSVFFHALIDVDGSLKQPSYIAGPQSLTADAAEALKTWKATPARVNGTPIVTVVTLRVGFKK
jgi:hypothetical protein